MNPFDTVLTAGTRATEVLAGDQLEFVSDGTKFVALVEEFTANQIDSSLGGDREQVVDIHVRVDCPHLSRFGYNTKLKDAPTGRVFTVLDIEKRFTETILKCVVDR